MHDRGRLVDYFHVCFNIDMYYMVRLQGLQLASFFKAFNRNSHDFSTDAARPTSTHNTRSTI